MSRTALLLIATDDDWWRHPARQALAREVFDLWWQGARTALLHGAAARGSGLPVPVERSFSCRHTPRPTPTLWLWLTMLGCERICVAGPGAAALADRLGRLGLAAAALGGRPQPGSPPPAGLPLRIA